MGDMMGAGIGNWILWWIFLGIAMVVAIGVVAARAPGTGRKTGQPLVPSAEPPAVQEAKDALRHRYAHGEISRQEYLHGKVELEG
jgi:putative membrane protein